MADFRIARGKTFLARIVWHAAIDGLTVSSSVETGAGLDRAVFPLAVIDWNPVARSFALTAQTESWPPGIYAWDIKAEGGGFTDVTPRKSFVLDERVTP